MDDLGNSDGPAWVIMSQLADPQWTARWIKENEKWVADDEIVPTFRKKANRGAGSVSGFPGLGDGRYDWNTTRATWPWASRSRPSRGASWLLAAAVHGFSTAGGRGLTRGKVKARADVTTKIDVAIVGASGYAARELIGILLRHPHARITVATSRQDETPRLDALHPSLARRIELTCEVFDAGADRRSGLLCVPSPAAYGEHGGRAGPAPARHARDRLERGLSLADPQIYTDWYGHAHTDPDGLRAAVYGLPELFRDRIPPADLIANPGCYTSASILALAPLIAGDRIERSGIIIDAKSGISGAGRSPKLMYHFPECNESLSAYSVGQHRHTPEIEQVLTACSGGRGGPVEVIFTPHLVPMDRGIFATVYAQPKRPAVEHDLLRLYR